MVDLDKERELFAKYNGREAMSPDEDAEEAGWLARAELAQAEITDLKQKLARYENPDYVLVPRNLSNELWEVMWKEFELSESMHEAHKAMIKAVEKEDD